MTFQEKERILYLTKRLVDELLYVADDDCFIIDVAAAVHCGSEEWLQEMLDELYEGNEQ